MIALLQRVSSASVAVDGETIASISRGTLVLVGIEQRDATQNAERLAERVVAYRLFPDPAGKMNLDVREAGGELLVVPQFTLAADTSKGTRPSFTPAAPPEAARQLFDCFVTRVDAAGIRVERGLFGAEMEVALVNQGPVTFWLRA